MFDTMKVSESKSKRMPELPEVQTVVNQLSEKIVGKTVAGFRSDWKKNVFPSSAAFVRRTKGTSVVRVRRLGKHIVIDLNNGYSIVIHLKMTGHLLVKDDRNRFSKAFVEDPYNGYIRHRFFFSDGTTLEFSDLRKFGWLRAMKTKDVERLPSINELGIDALDPLLTAKRFRETIFSWPERRIGEILLDQTLIAGIGNIYRSETLFLAGIRPDRRINSLSTEEGKKILLSARQVLRVATRLGGLSGGDFRDTSGRDGRFGRTAYVYGRDGEGCKKCGTIIKRKKIGQRSVFYCSRCQQ